MRKSRRQWTFIRMNLKLLTVSWLKIQLLIYETHIVWWWYGENWSGQRPIKSSIYSRWRRSQWSKWPSCPPASFPPTFPPTHKHLETKKVSGTVVEGCQTCSPNFILQVDFSLPAAKIFLLSTTAPHTCSRNTQIRKNVNTCLIESP